MAEQKFRLGTVLGYREFQLDRAVQDVARLNGRIQILVDGMAKLAGERESAAERALTSSQTSAANLHLTSLYMEALEAKEQVLGQEAAQLRGHLDRARAVVVQRQQSVDVLRRLRERLQVQNRQDETRREQRALDEVASLQSIRREER